MIPPPSAAEAFIPALIANGAGDGAWIKNEQNPMKRSSGLFFIVVG